MMLFKRKIETIPFSDFMAGYRSERKCLSYKHMTAYSFGFTWTGFFNMSPEMAGAYILITGIGLAGIIGHLLENHLASQHTVKAAEMISKTLNITLPTIGYGMILLLLWRLG